MARAKDTPASGRRHQNLEQPCGDDVAAHVASHSKKLAIRPKLASIVRRVVVARHSKRPGFRDIGRPPRMQRETYNATSSKFFPAASDPRTGAPELSALQQNRFLPSTYRADPVPRHAFHQGHVSMKSCIISLLKLTTTSCSCRACLVRTAPTAQRAMDCRGSADRILKWNRCSP